MRIALVTPVVPVASQEPDGLALRELAHALEEEGHEIVIIVHSPYPLNEKQLQAAKREWPGIIAGTGKIDWNPRIPRGRSRMVKIILSPENLFRLQYGNFDAVICDHAFMTGILGVLPEKVIRVLIPHLDPANKQKTDLMCRQRNWLAAMQAQLPSLFANADILIAEDEQEKKKLEDNTWLPVLNLSEGIREKTIGARLGKAIRDKGKSVLLIAESVFWRSQYALDMRIESLCRYLLGRFRFKLFCLLSMDADDQTVLAKMGLDRAVVFWGSWKGRKTKLAPLNNVFDDLPEALAKHARRVDSKMDALAAFLAASPHFDAIILEYMWNAYLMPAIQYPALTILDTHDVMAPRKYIFKEFPPPVDISLREEKLIYESFSACIFAERSEREFAAAITKKTIPIYAGGVFFWQNLPLREDEAHFGFVGTNMELNEEAIKWFLSEIWPFQTRQGSVLHIFGGICEKIKAVPSNVILHGIVKTQKEIYESCNVMISPVLRGTGIQTKTIGAIACGRPVIATPRGAHGIPSGPENGILVAKNREQFIEHMLMLSYDKALRAEIGRAASENAKRNFSMNACYGTLGELIARY